MIIHRWPPAGLNAGKTLTPERTPKQIAAARALVAYLAERYQIPADRVGTHDQFADGPTACPGANFPSQAIFGPRNVATR